MAANTGERTLIPTVIPPGAGHVNGVFSFGLSEGNARSLATIAASVTSLIADFAVRAAPKSGIYQGVFERLPVVADERLHPWLNLRLLRLTAMTAAYASLWAEAWMPEFAEDAWTGGIHRIDRPDLGEPSSDWHVGVPLRRSLDRRQALLEIDALVGIGLGISANELCTIYRTQFPVLFGYDRGQYVYDANGRLVPTPVLAVIRKTASEVALDERTWTHPGSERTYVFEAPFTTHDREAALQAAYTEFEARLVAS